MNSYIMYIINLAYNLINKKVHEDRLDPYEGKEAPWMKIAKYILLAFVLIGLVLFIVYGLVITES